MTMGRARKIRILPLTLTAAMILVIVAGCNKKADAPTQTPAAAATQPAATPAAPSKPVPSFSAAQKLGMYVFPGKNQTHDQQLIDESECYDLAAQQSGVNPDAAPPSPPTSGEMQAAEAQGAANAQQSQGGRARGAARGAAGGAMVGAITGNAGRGAAVGATVGTVRGGRQQRQSNAASQEAGASQAAGQVQQQYNQEKSAYDKQMGNYKRAFSACLDSRDYSVK
jgi:hypothetical protein